jgi:hypothetical protein
MTLRFRADDNAVMLEATDDVGRGAEADTGCPSQLAS